MSSLWACIFHPCGHLVYVCHFQVIIYFIYIFLTFLLLLLVCVTTACHLEFQEYRLLGRVVELNRSLRLWSGLSLSRSSDLHLSEGFFTSPCCSLAVEVSSSKVTRIHRGTEIIWRTQLVQESIAVKYLYSPRDKSNSKI